MTTLLPQLERACALGGETGGLIATLEWSSTPLGPIAAWPWSLQVIVSVCLSTKFPMVINWGDQFVQVYNDAARQVYGRKHPEAMGRPARTNFPEFWQLTQIEEVLKHIRATESPFHSENQWTPLERWGFREETYFTFGLSPMFDESGNVRGVLNTFIETTARVLSERRLATLRALGEQTARASPVADLCNRAMAALATNPRDIRFALLYFAEPDRSAAVLTAATGIEAGLPASPLRIPLLETPPPDSFAWPIAHAIATVQTESVEGLTRRFDIAAALRAPARTHAWSAPERALVLPLRGNGDERAVGALVVGLSPRLFHDEQYVDFLRLVANQIEAALTSARAYQETRDRAEKLAQLDRAKSVFYGNISHEFRTPLTLLLSPVEELLGRRDGTLAAPLREVLETVRRNALRLLKLVNGLLDFARIESGRMELRRQPIDLSSLTREVVSAFELAIRQAGLGLTVRCPPLPRPVCADPEQWEKIVSNLLSNALKYTRQGKIVVTQRAIGDRVELSVHDTGIGIAAEDLPHLFERFYRVRGSPGRSVEGAGIGLALVDALVKLHGGTVQVESTLHQGTTLTVTIPFATESLGQVLPAAPTELPALGTAPWVEEARSWADDGRVATTAAKSTPAPSPMAIDVKEAAAEEPRRHILVVEDNADMRQYLVKLLAPQYDVEAVGNGEVALAVAESHAPDIVLSDLLLPGLDGFALLHALRADPRTGAVPIVLISAQAGEEAALEGLGGGADDYLRKPFSARELLARVRTHLELADSRRASAEYQMMDAFIGIVSHELRTPVTTLKLVVQGLERDFAGADATLNRSLGKLARAVGRMEVLVEDIVSVAAIKSGQLTLKQCPRDLAAVCRAAAEEEATTSNVAMAIELDLPDQPLMATIDEMRMLQVVTNLISNARKFSPPDRPIALSLHRRGNEADLAVRDRGPGIPRDEVPHLFERFHRVPGIKPQRGSRTGLGLGLYICKGIVEQHHGRIWVETEEGRGSTFHVVLPLEPSISESVAAPVDTECHA